MIHDLQSLTCKHKTTDSREQSDRLHRFFWTTLWISTQI